MMNLPNTKFFTDFEYVKQELSVHEKFIAEKRTLKRLMQIIEKGMTDNRSGEKSWALRFLRSPKEFIPNSMDNPASVKGVVYYENRLEGPPEKCTAVPTGKIDSIETSLVIKSLGYRSIPLEGIPFDQKKGVVPNQKGKVL